MFSLFKRQRRRLHFFAAFTALPCAILVFVSAWQAWGTVVALASGIAAGAGIMAIPLCILSFAPRFRSLCEAIVIALIIGSAFQIATLPLADIPVIGPWRAVFGIAAFGLFFYFDVPTRFLPPRDYIGSAHFRTDRSVYTLWAEHLPDPGLLDRHWSDELHDLVMNRKDPSLRIATYRTPQGDMRQRQQMTDETTHVSFAYGFTQLLDDDSDGPTGSYALAIKDYGTNRDVTISQRVNKLPIMTWLATWLDDIVGDECDHHLARDLNLADHSITGNRVRKAPHRPVGPIAPEALAV